MDSLEPHPGIWIQAEGEYTDKDGKVKRVAVSIGPEYGTVGSDHIKDAAKEAVQAMNVLALSRKLNAPMNTATKQPQTQIQA